jgi:DNA-binding XRE family transcriptional regulator
MKPPELHILLKQYRESLGITQMDFARHYGYATPTPVVSLWESGYRQIPNVIIADMISYLLERVNRQVIGDDEAPKPNPKSKDIHERLGTCWTCYENDYCIHEIRDELRDDQRRQLKKLIKGA